MAPPRQRITLDLSQRASADVRSLANHYGMTEAAIIRLALELLLVANQAKTEGMTVGAWQEYDSRRVERVFTGV